MFDVQVFRQIVRRLEAEGILSQEEIQFLVSASQSGHLRLENSPKALGDRAIAVGSHANHPVLVTGDGNSISINDVGAIGKALRKILGEHLQVQEIIIPARRGLNSATAIASDLSIPAISFSFQYCEFDSKTRETQKKQAIGLQWIEDLGQGINLEMVRIPGGSFLMGSPDIEAGRLPTEAPQHTVNVSEFWMSKYLITQAQWKAVAALPSVNRKLKPKPSKFKGENLPVEGVSWFDAVEFCDRLHHFIKYPYRLPSEAEWEYACRAGTTTAFYCDDMINPELANYKIDVSPASNKKKSQGRTVPVGNSQIANPFGLYDMHGNLWEWCVDCWQDNYENAATNNGTSITDGDNHARVTRGGSWFDSSHRCRSASRANDDPEVGSSAIGFRVVFSLDQVI